MGLDLPSGRSPTSAQFARFLSGEQGTELVTFASTDSHTRNVDFVVPFAAAPRVFCNINNSAGVTQRWHVRAFNVTQFDFDMLIQSAVAGSPQAWTNVPVFWVALDP